MNKVKILIQAVAFSALIVNSGCDLELQENFDFQPAVDLTDPFDDMTAWEFIQTQVSDSIETLGYNGEKLDFMIEAIRAADMIDEYNDPTANRTYLLLNNSAFTGGGDVIDIITAEEGVNDGVPEEVFVNGDVCILKQVLSYHVVEDFVAQVPTLFEFNVNYKFQTLIPGDSGVIYFNRDERYRVTVNDNSPAAPLPSSATSQNERVRNHNYVFNNGIGHYLSDPVRYDVYRGLQECL